MHSGSHWTSMYFRIFICSFPHICALGNAKLTLRSYGLLAYEICHYSSFQTPFYTLRLIMKAVWYLCRRSINVSQQRKFLILPDISCLGFSIFPILRSFLNSLFAGYYVCSERYSCVCITHFRPWIVFTLSSKPVWTLGISYLNCLMVLDQCYWPVFWFTCLFFPHKRLFSHSR